MQHFLSKTVVTICIIISLISANACKTGEEALPEVRIGTVNSINSEGDTIVFVNQTVNGRSFEWTIAALGYRSTEKEPSLVIDSAATYEVRLKAVNGEGRSSESVYQLEVLPDSVYRLSRNSMKVWTVKSIKYGGNEMLTQSCQMDDEFTVYRGAADTCQLTEGVQTCPSGTYIFELPASSTWRFVSDKKAFEFSLTAFGTPVNLSFVTEELTHTVFKGTDNVNGVSIYLEARP